MPLTAHLRLPPPFFFPFSVRAYIAVEFEENTLPAVVRHARVTAVARKKIAARFAKSNGAKEQMRPGGLAGGEAECEISMCSRVGSDFRRSRKNICA